MTISLSERFTDLFVGSDLTYGQWNPKNGKMHTEKGAPTQEAFSKHLSGEMGIGIVPIAPDGMCMWGAIDIDNHNDEKIKPEVIAKTLYGKGIPLIPCLSKSGGVHCYLFLSEPTPAAMVQRALRRWAAEIGHQGAEIFPKQEELRDNLTGNWLNLPYFDAVRTQRYGMEVRNGRILKLSPSNFAKYAVSCRMSTSMLRSFILAGHEQAPPCLQELILSGVKVGMRNEVLYAFTLYLRKKCPPATAKQEILNINQQIFTKPLSLSEANRTIQSASRRDYKYKCMESPFKDLCDSKTCLTREFGIEPSDSFETAAEMPPITRLRVLVTEPPLWELTMDNKPIIVDTSTLRNFAALAARIMESLLIVVPVMSQKEWMPILADLISKVETIEAPDNASIDGVIRERLIEFIDRADYNSSGKDPRDKELILRGLPVVQEIDKKPGFRLVYFRGSDFISFLKRTRSEELKGTSLWMALRKMGVEHTRTRVNKKMINVWAVPIDGRGRTKLDYDYNPKSLYSEMEEANIRLMTKINF